MDPVPWNYQITTVPGSQPTAMEWSNSGSIGGFSQFGRGEQGAEVYHKAEIGVGET